MTTKPQETDDLPLEGVLPEPREAALTWAATLGGAAVGAVAGLPGAVLGGLLGAVAGAGAGAVLEAEEHRKEAHDHALDDAIGVTDGDLGACPVRRAEGEADPPAADAD